MLFVRVRSTRFISNSLAAATATIELLCLAFCPPASDESSRPIFPHRAVKRKFYGATVKRSWSQSGCSFCCRELSLGRSVGPPQLAHRLTRFFQSTLFSFPPRSLLRLFTLIHASPPFRLSYSLLPTLSNPLQSNFFRGYNFYFSKYEYISRPVSRYPRFDGYISITFREK